MLTYLFDYLEQLDFPGAGLFQYISFRAAMALITSLIVSIIFGKRFINLLRRQQIGETVRDLGLAGQIEKSGTPTMGGIIILSAILIPTLLFAKLHNIYVITMIIATIWLGAIGFLDDYIKVFKKNKEGLAGRFKIIGQIGVGLIVGCIMYFHPDVQVHKRVDADYKLQAGESFVTHQHTSDETDSIPAKWIETRDMTTTIPFINNNEFNYNWLIGDFDKSYGWLLFIPLVIVIVIAVSNGANMTDGLDGLATGTSAIAGIALGHSGLCDFQHSFRRLPRCDVCPLRRRTRDFHCRLCGSVHRIFVVQQLSGAGIHGRYRKFGSWVESLLYLPFPFARNC